MTGTPEEIARGGGKVPSPRGEDAVASYSRVNLAIAIGLALFGLGVIFATALTITPSTNRITYDPVGPRGMPFAAGALCLVLGSLLTISVLRGRREGELSRPVQGDLEGGDDPRYAASSVQAFKVVLWTFAYALVLNPLGYLIATPLHIFACLWTVGTRRRSLLVVFPVVYTIVTYAIFGPLLNVRIPLGPLAGVMDALGLD